ncbi:hypothetical protein NID80_32625 [Paraburkholderia megapolitana]|nr:MULTISPECIES: hypothetical protein [Paraburkholderia]MCX4166256.1 hypothetical protein [Paraburkholderia megapolitana]MDN7161746.1 hypothetical protein [Paraburkholderia sp. CHISQ3]MDQ6498794.1 hypothetical protein [Paraburkholderia megapolitana]
MDQWRLCVGARTLATRASRLSLGARSLGAVRTALALDRRSLGLTRVFWPVVSSCHRDQPAIAL